MNKIGTGFLIAIGVLLAMLLVGFLVGIFRQ